MTLALLLIGASIGSTVTVLMLWGIHENKEREQRRIEAMLKRSRLAHWN